MVPWVTLSASESLQVHLSDSEGIPDFSVAPWVMLSDYEVLQVHLSNSEGL